MIAAARTPKDEAPPVHVFSELDGTWVGTFVGYDERGAELYRIRARHTYRTVDETTQRVEIADTMPDGRVIRGVGANTSARRADGSLALRCVVEKSDGDRVEHEGRLVEGPDGHTEIVWFTNQPGRIETFREFVTHEGDETFYSIQGMGRYGESMILMVGRYKKQ